MELTREFLLSLFEYDRERGVLIWKDHWLGHVRYKFVGKEAGSPVDNRYLYVGIKNKHYRLHRIIYFLETNESPPHVDHINGDIRDNRFSNLRASNSARNQRNRKSHREGRLPGVTFRKRSGRWEAKLQVNGKRKWLGEFDTEVEAHNKYLQAVREFNV